jgi:uncharacterized protein YhhL (DUF1145 family)
MASTIQRILHLAAIVMLLMHTLAIPVVNLSAVSRACLEIDTFVSGPVSGK